MSAKELAEYKDTKGTEAALNLLLLVGPDGFTGDYTYVLSCLEAELNANS